MHFSFFFLSTVSILKSPELLTPVKVYVNKREWCLFMNILFQSAV